jgi:integrase
MSAAPEPVTLSDTRSGGPQLVTMNATARQVLKAFEASRGTSEWVLPSVSNPKRPISIAGIEAAAQIKDVRMHDLRHTVGTYVAHIDARN